VTTRESIGQLVQFLRNTVRRPTSAQDKVRAVARFGWRQVHKRMFRKPMIVAWEGMKLIVPPNATSAGAAYYFGRQDLWELAFIVRLLRPGDLVVDVGANVGVYTMFMAKSVGRGGTVIACEPDPNNQVTLRENVILNGLTQIQNEEVAVGESDGEVRFLTGLGTVSRVSSGEDGVTLAMRSLDSLCAGRDPVLVKVDVEGGEDAVLRGANDAMQRGMPLVWQLEVPAEPRDDEPLYVLLRDKGYVFGVYDLRDGRVRVGPVSQFKGECNVLALRDCPALRERLGANGMA